MSRTAIPILATVFGLSGLASNVNSEVPGELHVASPDWREQIIYFLMIDRFNDGNPGNNDQGHGEYDPSKGSHYSGGDLAGIKEKIPYIKALGATAVWITPPVAHQWWSVPSNYGGYHGYWGENLMQVDAHFGGLRDMQALSRALHGQDMYLVQDIVVNHMGNYFTYDPTVWDPAKPSAGFRLLPDSGQGKAPSQAPFGFNNAADPAQAAKGIYHWTPDIRDYTDPVQEHNWQMAGLDDLNTESAEVRKALRQSYGFWIAESGVDAFRVDTAFYVPPAFFRDFLQADDAEHPGVLEVARQTGRDDFLVFGEGFAIDKPFEDRQSRKIEGYVRDADGNPLMQGMLNFPLYGTGLDVFAKGQPTAQMAHRIETMMAVHADPHRMPSFVDNHDVDRFLQGGSTAALKQNLLLIMTLPGIPVIYYGTEQGLTGQRDALFKQGFGAGGKDRFDAGAPLFKAIQSMAALRRSHKLFSHGTPHVLRSNPAGPGILAYRMTHDAAQALVLFNTAETDILLDNLDTGWPAGSRLAVKYTQQAFDAEPVLGSRGELTLVLPGRSALVLMPDGTHGVPPPDAHRPVLDALPARVDSAVLAVSGTAAPDSRLQLVLDGDLAHATDVASDGRGRWQGTLATDALMDSSIAHRLVLWDPRTHLASEAGSFRSEKPWREILRVDDPKRDDHGRSGRLSYPDDPGWTGKHPGDIERITVHQAGSALKIEITLGDIIASWNPPNGFDHVALTAFLELPGADGGSRILPLQNGELPDGMRWHYRLRAGGWSNAWFTAEGADADNEGTAASPGAGLQVDRERRTVSFLLPAKALGNPASLSGARLYINTWDYDAGYRALSAAGKGMSFRGGGPDDAKVLDESAVLVLP